MPDNGSKQTETEEGRETALPATYLVPVGGVPLRQVLHEGHFVVHHVSVVPHQPQTRGVALVPVQLHHWGRLH